MAYWNFEYTKAVIYTVVKVGGGIGQDPATEVTHLRLNLPPVCSSDIVLCPDPFRKNREGVWDKCTKAAILLLCYPSGRVFLI